jgi:hypothetical protein
MSSTGLLLLVAAAAVLASPVVPGNKKRDDCQQVVREVPGWLLPVTTLDDRKNGSVLGAEQLKELKSESDQAVAVGNHHLFDTSSTEPLQKGCDALASVVKSRADIANDCVLGILGA